MNANKIIALVIGLLLVGILLPIGLNQFNIPITGTRELNRYAYSTFKIDESGDYANPLHYNISTSGEIAKISILVNITQDSDSDNMTYRFKLSCSNTTLIPLYDPYINANGVGIGNFTAVFGTSLPFAFNTIFSYNNSIATSYNSVQLDFYAQLFSNMTFTNYAYMREVITNDSINTINTMYIIIPILAVISLIIMVIPRKEE